MLNDTEIKKCLYAVLAILVAMLGLVGLASMGHDIPVLRQAVGFIFLTLVPGSLILRILRIHNIGTARGLVYAVGLSLAFIMFSGLLANLVFPLFGISRPISVVPLTVSLAVFIVVLSLMAYLRDKGFVSASQPGFLSRLAPRFLLLILLPLLAVLGALLVNYYQNNALLLAFVATVAVIIGLSAFGKFVPEKDYPLVIAVIAIALLYHTTATLANSFLTGYDIQAEYLYQGYVVQSGHWNPAIPGNISTALSIVMLTPIYSLLLNMEAVWVFKVIYPLFFSMVPVALFQAYQEQIGARRAFFSTLLFMSVIVFFGGVGNRQQVGELFFALLLLLMVEGRISLAQKRVLAIVFVMSLPVSHYGLAYVCLFLFIAGWLMIDLPKSSVVPISWPKWARRLSSLLANPGRVASVTEHSSSTVLTGSLVALYVVFALAWYMYTASGTMFSALITIPQHVIASIGEFFNPTARESLVGTAIGLDLPSVSNLGRAFRIIQYTIQLFIVTGFIRLFVKPLDFRFRTEHVVLTVLSVVILLACIVLPYFSGHLEVDRFYHLTLFLLSPLCVLGGEAIWRGLSGLSRSGLLALKAKGEPLSPSDTDRTATVYLRFLALAVVIPYFLFNTGFIFEVAKSERYNVVDIPSSEALSSYRVDMKVSNQREHTANKWLGSVVDNRALVYADEYGKLQHSVALYGRTFGFGSDVSQMPGNSYIYLRTWNLTRKEVVVMVTRGEQIKFAHVSLDDLPEVSRLVASRNLIYNNGGAQVLAP